tara:strand:+ start:3688 stop:4653 length:966 start_codon:yes stop_codon:yes gene_type:complete
MRQAGRYMYEYNDIKKNFNSFFKMCRDTDAVKEITLLPVKKFGFDAGIIFSDILIILECLDVKVEFIPNKGPLVDNKNLNKIFLEKNYNINYEGLKPVYKSIRKTKNSLTEINKPLIGFAGAPWTVAAYYLESTLTKDLTIARKVAYEKPELMHNIIDTLSEIIIEHLSNQINAGVDIVQIFDTHSNILDYLALEAYSIEPIRKICKEIKKRYPKVPISYFSKNINLNFNDFFDHIDIISFNSSVRMRDYIGKLPKELVFQGNLDPIKLLVGGKEMEKAILEILKDMQGKDFIFNLGHGILPKTPRENVIKCIKLVKESKG